MKKRFWFLSFVILLTGCTVLLSGCTILLPSSHGEIASSGDVTMSVQFPVYDKSIDRIQVIIENGGDTTLEYGVEWAVEVKKGDAWMQIPFRDGYGWVQPLLMLMPGGTDSFYVSAEMLDYAMKDGQYRVVKELSGTVYAAEFQIGDSAVTAKAPFGYVPMEDLPMDYSAEDAAEDGVVVYHSSDKIFENEEKIAAFLQDVVLGLETQIRFAFYSSNTPDKLLLEEIIFTKPDGHTPRFQHQWDFRRQQPDVSILGQYYSYLTTHNDKLFYLSDTLHPHDLGDNSRSSPYVLSEDWNGKEEWLEIIEQYAAGRYSGVSAWSPDGLRYVQASMDEALTFFVNIHFAEGGSRGYTADLLGEKTPVSIKAFIWADNTTVMIVCSTKEKGTDYYAFYDTESQEITSYTTSSHGYTVENGEILILE